MSCQAVNNGEVKRRGEASVEGYGPYKNPIYFCLGYNDLLTDELIQTCKDCKENVIYADELFDKSE